MWEWILEVFFGLVIRPQENINNIIVGSGVNLTVSFLFEAVCQRWIISEKQEWRWILFNFAPSK